MVVYAIALYRHGDRIDRPGWSTARNSKCTEACEWCSVQFS